MPMLFEGLSPSSSMNGSITVILYSRCDTESISMSPLSVVSVLDALNAPATISSADCSRAGGSVGD